MIDIHCHILSGIDDGARNLETSVEMCKIARANGIKHIVATPHFKTTDGIERFVSLRDEKIAELKNQVRARGIDVKLYPGAEVFLDENVFFSDNLQKLAINGSRYLLVEFSFFERKTKKIFSYLSEIVEMGLVPIIAHPERYEFFQSDYEIINDLASRGAIFQINASSLASLDGQQEFELAYSMAYNGLASFIGTDAHSVHRRPNNLGEMMRYFPPDIGRRNMQIMVHESAECVLTDRELPFTERGTIFKRGF